MFVDVNTITKSELLNVFLRDQKPLKSVTQIKRKLHNATSPWPGNI